MPCPYHHTYTNNKATARPEEHMKSYRLVSVYINKNLFGFAWIKVTFQNRTIPSPLTFILLHGRNVLLFVSLARRSVSTLEVSTGNETNLETSRNYNFEIFVLGQQKLAELGSSYASKLKTHIKNEMHNKERNFERDQYVLDLNVLKSVFSTGGDCFILHCLYASPKDLIKQKHNYQTIHVILYVHTGSYAHDSH